MLYLFLSARALHILCAALWLGGTILMSFFLLPTLGEVGPAAGKVMSGMERRGLTSFFPTIGGLTILSGFYLFYRAMSTNPEFMRSLGGKVFGVGAILGLAAMIIGASVVGRAAKKMSELGPKAATLPAGSPELKALQATMQALQHRAGVFGKVVAFLLIVTLILMSIGHYV